MAVVRLPAAYKTNPRRGKFNILFLKDPRAGGNASSILRPPGGGQGQIFTLSQMTGGFRFSLKEKIIEPLCQPRFSFLFFGALARVCFFESGFFDSCSVF